MASTVRIPPELFEEILSRVEDEHDLLRDYEDREARKRSLRSLATCSSVCPHWANFIRPGMFQLLVLRSAQDLYDLLALLRMPCSPGIRSIAHCLRTVVVFYRFKDYFWCHNLQRLHTYGVHAEVSLRIHISGSTPRKKERTVRHPLFYTIPKIVPFHRDPLIYVDLIIEAVHFLDGAGVLNLIRDIGHSGILPRSIRCNRVRWEDGLTLPMTSIDPTFSLNRHAHFKSFDVSTTECTDNFLAAFAIHSHIGPRGRDAVMLNPSDADRFLNLFSDWASVARKTFLGESPIESRAIHASPHFGREGSNRLSASKADQGMTGCLWRTHAAGWLPSSNKNVIDASIPRYEPLYREEDVVAFGFYTRPEQGHGLGSAQTAYIGSIVIDICSPYIIEVVDWRTFLIKALEFPMLDTLKVSVHGWDELRDFVGRQRETLAVAEAQGRLSLCLLEGDKHTLKDEYRREVDLSDVPVTYATMRPPRYEPAIPQPGHEDWRRVLGDEIESDGEFTRATVEPYTRVYDSRPQPSPLRQVFTYESD